VTEAEFQKQVIDLAQLFRWRVAHFRPARTAKGWRTPVAADGAGFPDLVLAKEGRLIFAELKAEKGRVSEAQALWLESLGPSTEDRLVVVWRPSDWDSIERVIRGNE
jgi:hypothetical protein